MASIMVTSEYGFKYKISNEQYTPCFQMEKQTTRQNLENINKTYEI